MDGSTKRESKNTTQQREAFILEQVQEVSCSEEIPGEELSAYKSGRGFSVGRGIVVSLELK